METTIQEMQLQLDPTTGAKIVPMLPMAFKPGTYSKVILLSPGKYIEVHDFGADYNTIMYSSAPHREPVPIADLLNELEQIIADVRRAHGIEHNGSVIMTDDPQEHYVPESRL